MIDTIAKIESYHLAIPSVYGGPPPRGAAQWPLIELVLVRVESQAGLVGWGEAFGHRACATTHAAIETLIAPLCVGRSAEDAADLANGLRRALHPYGLEGAIGFALSGLDIAMWDIAGKRQGVRVCDLLAARPPDSVPTYASLLRYGDPDRVGEAAAGAVARGFGAVKLHEATYDATAAARNALGPDVPLMLDVNGRWSVDETIEFARRLEPLALAWLEEPCWPADTASLAQVAAATAIPIAAGENAAGLDGLAALVSAGRVAYLQPSVAKLGGLTALLAARPIADRFGAKLATHSAYFGPGLAATAHFCAAFGLDCEWYDCRLEASPGGGLPVGGRLPIPARPGLGLAIDDGLIAAYLAKGDRLG